MEKEIHEDGNSTYLFENDKELEEFKRDLMDKEFVNFSPQGKNEN